MQKIISLYTLLYLFIIFCSNILQFLPGPGISLIREGYILFLIISCVVYFDKLHIKKISFIIFLYILSNFISFKISENQKDALSSFILYISGPLIFILLTSLPLTENNITLINKHIRQLFIFFIVTALMIYPIQKQFYSIFGLDKGEHFINLYRFKSNGDMMARLSGLAVHPTTIGAICFFMIIHYILAHKKIKSFIMMIPLYLSNTRSILIGSPFAWYTFLSSKKKVWITILIPFIIASLILIMFNSVFDSSTIIHFNDLLEYGPKLLFGNIKLFGHGHGTMSPFSTKPSFFHVESDLYIAIMQIGIIGISLYLTIFSIILFQLKKDNNIRSKYCAYVFICINVGCLFLSYYVVRFITNYMWIELALYYANRKKLCKQ